MQLGYTIIYVPSVPAALDFYQRAFEISARFCVPDETYGELELPSTTTLAFANESFVQKNMGSTNSFRLNRSNEEQSAGVQISLVVDKAKGETIEGVFKRAVDAGATSVKEPATKPWGQSVAYVRDLNGFIVELATPVSA